MTKIQVRLVIAAPLVALFASEAWAQVGSGWSQYQPSSTIQLDGSDGIESSPGTVTNRRNEGASFRKSGGVETFTIFDPISNRAERRMRNEYTGGRWQFQGEVRLTTADGQSVMQIFGGRTPATTQMIRAYNSGGGTLKKIPGSVTLATGIRGKWVRINVIHDIGANRVQTFVNGQLKATGDGEAPSRWYHKYGCYGTLGVPTAKVEWRNVKHFRRSSSNDEEAFDPEEKADPDERFVDRAEAAAQDLVDDHGTAELGCAVGPGSAGRSRFFGLGALALALAMTIRRRRRISGSAPSTGR